MNNFIIQSLKPRFLKFRQLIIWNCGRMVSGNTVWFQLHSNIFAMLISHDYWFWLKSLILEHENYKDWHVDSNVTLISAEEVTNMEWTLLGWRQRETIASSKSFAISVYMESSKFFKSQFKFKLRVLNTECIATIKKSEKRKQGKLFDQIGSGGWLV